MNFALQLVVDLLYSWGRMLVALGLSIVFSVFVGIAAATSKRAEAVVLPAIDVLQTVPILAFFPVVIYLIAPLGYIGLNAAVVLLIFTSMAWNITFGVYEAVKSIPADMLEIARISHLSKFQMIRSIYAPAAMPRIAYQSSLSWSIGLFYLVTSEIFSAGSKNFAVTYGIGVEDRAAGRDAQPDDVRGSAALPRGRGGPNVGAPVQAARGICGEVLVQGGAEACQVLQGS